MCLGLRQPRGMVAVFGAGRGEPREAPKVVSRQPAPALKAELILEWRGSFRHR